MKNTQPQTHVVKTLAAALALISGSAIAAPVTLNFSSEISFSPNTTIAAGGYSIGNALNQSFGISDNSTSFIVNGSLTYDYDQAAAQTGEYYRNGYTGYAAAYNNPITAFELTIAETMISANIAEINANSDSATSGVRALTSDFGLNNPEIGGASIQLVQYYYPEAIQTGNAGIVADNTAVEVNGPDGTTTFGVSDSIAFTLGTTDIADFGPGFNTDAGEFALSSAGIIMVGNAGINLFDGTELPTSLDFYDTESFDTAIVALVFELDGQTLSMPFQADITSFELDANPVPVPAAAWLFGSALMGLGVIARKRS